jgi:hypothetical protein
MRRSLHDIWGGAARSSLACPTPLPSRPCSSLLYFRDRLSCPCPPGRRFPIAVFVEIGHLPKEDGDRSRSPYLTFTR